MAKRRTGARGVALVMVTIAIVTLFAMAGLAIDAGQMYVTKQMAQAAADAGAQAGVMDMYNGTNGGTGSASAIAYAQLNGFNTPADTVTPSWPSCSSLTWCNGHVTLVSTTPNLIQVTVSRVVQTTFLRALGITSTTVSATAYAALSYGPAAVPIVVTHPHLVDALQLKGNSQVTITGGPTRAIQINSDGTLNAGGHPEAYSVSGSGSINLSQAGPAGTGADFRSWGPGASNNINHVAGLASCPTWLCVGSTGNYVQPASLIMDPFLGLSQPVSTGLPVGSSTSVGSGTSLNVAGCGATCTGKKGCTIYSPGTYASGIIVKNTTAYFNPGLYYITSADTNGFVGAANSDMEMLSSVCPNIPNDPGTGSGMVVFNAGSGPFTVGANGNAILLGPLTTNTTYEGIIFWQDRTRNPGAVVANSFGGGGTVQITGTIYTSMLVQNVTGSNYQLVSLGGNAGSTTTIIGEIVTNVLYLTGGGSITMQLTSTQLKDVHAVAFVE